MSLQQAVQQRFKEEFGEDPAFIVRSPGRVNLIGEHTDYNDGFVFPMAIDRATWIALRPRQDNKVVVVSADLEDKQEFNLADLQRPEKTNWIDYLIGVTWALQERDYTLTGWDGVVTGDVPIASGLSSSAALELATARAFYTVSDFEWDAATMAKVGMSAENDWLGVQTGIMDQMISAAGVENRALLIDCRSLETSTAPLPHNTAVVILDTSTRRGLVDSKYNERREQCEAAAKHFGVKALRDVDIETFNQRVDELEPLIQMRARHIITENDRTLRAKEAMNNSDPETLGKLMVESHISLRDDFEVSSKALDIIVDCANAEDSCYGARMTGAGFGGCAVALVKADAVQEFVTHVESCYTSKTDHTPKIYITLASNGAETIYPQ
jgi:galactokinase